VRKPTILWVSDNPNQPTGLGRVTREVLTRLSAKGYAVTCLSFLYDGWPYDTDFVPFPVLPAPPIPTVDCVTRAMDLCNPDVIISFGDLWMMPWVTEQKRKGAPKIIGYITIDGGPIPPSRKAELEAFDTLVAPTNFGKRQLEDLLPQNKIQMIYHGVDTSVFRPLNKKALLRKKFGIGEEFVVGCVARNQMRKYFPALLEAFAKFHRLHPESILYLHTSREKRGWALDEFIAQYDIASCVRFPDDYTLAGLPCLRDANLNEVYNLFDVMVLPTIGEGFGLPMLESMAAGTPVIATNYSACVELLEGHGLLIDVKNHIYAGREIYRYALPDQEDLLSKLCKIWSDNKLRGRLARDGVQFSRRFAWKGIIAEWEALISSCLVPGRGIHRRVSAKESALAAAWGAPGRSRKLALDDGGPHGDRVPAKGSEGRVLNPSAKR